MNTSSTLKVDPNVLERPLIKKVCVCATLHTLSYGVAMKEHNVHREVIVSRVDPTNRELDDSFNDVSGR